MVGVELQRKTGTVSIRKLTSSVGIHKLQYVGLRVSSVYLHRALSSFGVTNIKRRLLMNLRITIGINFQCLKK
jgi:hypothetical protein